MKYSNRMKRIFKQLQFPPVVYQSRLSCVLSIMCSFYLGQIWSGWSGYIRSLTTFSDESGKGHQI